MDHARGFIVDALWSEHNMRHFEDIKTLITRVKAEIYKAYLNLSAFIKNKAAYYHLTFKHEK